MASPAQIEVVRLRQQLSSVDMTETMVSDDAQDHHFDLVAQLAELELWLFYEAEIKQHGVWFVFYNKSTLPPIVAPANGYSTNLDILKVRAWCMYWARYPVVKPWLVEQMNKDPRTHGMIDKAAPATCCASCTIL